MTDHCDVSGLSVKTCSASRREAAEGPAHSYDIPGQSADSNPAPAPSAASLLDEELQRRVRELEEQLEAAEESLAQKDQELEAMQVQLQQSHKQATTAPVPAVPAHSVSTSRHVNEMERLAAMMVPEQRDVPSAVAPSKHSLQVSPLLLDTARCSISQPLASSRSPLLSVAM